MQETYTALTRPSRQIIFEALHRAEVKPWTIIQPYSWTIKILCATICIYFICTQSQLPAATKKHILDNH